MRLQQKIKLFFIEKPSLAAKLGKHAKGIDPRKKICNGVCNAA